MALPAPHNLIVEGSDDKHSLIAILKAYGLTERIIEIHDAQGRSNILTGNLVETVAKGQLISSIGIILDADNDANATYQSLRSHLKEFAMPATLPPAGLIHNSGNIRLGVWVMPDNLAGGSLEELLTNLIPNTARELWDHAVASTAASKAKGAGFKLGDSSKAEIHSFLAWQNPPGNPYGTSISARAFTVPNPYLSPLIDWISELTSFDFKPTAP